MSDKTRWSWQAVPIRDFALAVSKDRRVKRNLALILASGAVSALLSLIVPLTVGWLYGVIIPHGAREQLPWLFAVLLAVALTLAAGEYLRGRLFLLLISRWDRGFHARVFSRLLHAKPGFLRARSSGDWAGRLLGLADARRVVGPPVLTAVFGLSAGIANFIYMLLVQSLLAVAALSLTVALGAVTVFLTRRQIRADLAMSRLEGHLGGFTATIMGNLPALHRVGATDRAAARLRRLFAEMQAAHGKAQDAVDALLAVNAGFALLAPLLLFALVGFVLARPEPAKFLAFYAAFGQMLFALLGAVTALTTLARAAAPVSRVLPLLQAPLESSGADPGSCFRGLTLENVIFRYQPDAPPALNGVDFSLTPGEIVALTGASGSGKTSLLKLVLGLEEAQEGLVWFNGQPIKHWDIGAVRRLAGVALQASPLFPGSIAENIAGLEQNGSTQDITAMASLTGLPLEHPALPQGLATVIDDPPGLSEPLRQRIVLARALIRRPDLLLLDETTNALPPALQTRVFKHIRSTGAACLVITHNREAITVADRVIKLAEGRIAAVTRP